MGGPGSGTKWEKKGTVEDRQCLDVRELHRAHGIKPGSEMTINYEWRGEELSQKIFLDWTPCKFGGQRPWFICGNCGTRVAVLYGAGKYFACRHCLNLTYRSSQENDSRFNQFLRNYDGFSEVDDLPLNALSRLWDRISKEKEQLQKGMNRKRRGRPAKKADGPQ
jgi:hypothetical protein